MKKILKKIRGFFVKILNKLRMIDAKKVYLTAAAVALAVIILIFMATMDRDEQVAQEPEPDWVYVEITDVEGNVIERRTRIITTAETYPDEDVYEENGEDGENGGYTIGDGRRRTTTTTVTTTINEEWLEELKVYYSDIADMINTVSRYRTLNNIIRLGEVEDNERNVEPFSEENFPMFFVERKFFEPIFPQGYRVRDIYLSARGHFRFHLRTPQGENTYLTLYARTSPPGQELGSFELAGFRNVDGYQVHRNGNRRYAMILDNMFIAEYSVRNRQFMRQLRFVAHDIFPPITTGTRS